MFLPTRGVMAHTLLSSFSHTAADMRGKIGGIYALLIAANVAAWAWALIAFHDYPVLLGTAVLAYSFGLRHAVDADHIAAIDNVTRKLRRASARSRPGCSSRSGIQRWSCSRLSGWRRRRPPSRTGLRISMRSAA
jgi:hypothetical protein